MNKIIFFRGKAATGKTLLTNLLGKKLGIAILRKDDVFDSLFSYKLETSQVNGAAYDILAKIIQSNVEARTNLIVDIGLAHAPYFEQFIKKIDFQKTKVVKFLCICSDEKKWQERIDTRSNSTIPNQAFRNYQEAKNYYAQLSTLPLGGEVVLDSAKDISKLIEEAISTVK